MKHRVGRRRSKAHVGPYTVLFFVTIVLGAGTLSMWLENRYQKAETAYRDYVARHPFKAGEKPPRVDWLTGKIWH